MCARAIRDVEIAQQLGLFMLVWVAAFPRVFKFTEFEETRFDNEQRLNFKHIYHATREMKLIATAARRTTNAARSDRHSHRRVHAPAERSDFALNDIPERNFKQAPDTRMIFPTISKWNLDFE